MHPVIVATKHNLLRWGWEWLECGIGCAMQRTIVVGTVSIDYTAMELLNRSSIKQCIL